MPGIETLANAANHSGPRSSTTSVRVARSTATIASGVTSASVSLLKPRMWFVSSAVRATAMVCASMRECDRMISTVRLTPPIA